MSKILSKGIRKGIDKNGNLVLYFIIEDENKEAAETLFNILKEEPTISFKAKKEYGKRTGKQNKMFWSLVNKIAMHTSGNIRQSSLDQVYLDLIREANRANEFLWLSENQLENARNKYKFLINTNNKKVNKEGEEYTLYNCFYGTSKMDVYDMMELIEVALDQMAFLGIEDNESIEISNNLRQLKKNLL